MDHPVQDDRQSEMTMRIGFYISLVIFLIILFMYITSLGTENETAMLLITLGSLVPMLGTVFLWRRAYWRMRRSALEDGYD